MSSNAAGALAGLLALEDEAERAHNRVAEALEGARVLLDGAIVERYRQEYQITGLRAYRGVVHAYGVRIYRKKKRCDDATIGVREYDLNDFRECKIIQYRDPDAPPFPEARKPPANLCWHENHPKRDTENPRTS